jgi:hypothetical protein
VLPARISVTTLPIYFRPANATLPRTRAFSPKVQRLPHHTTPRPSLEHSITPHGPGNDLQTIAICFAAPRRPTHRVVVHLRLPTSFARCLEREYSHFHRCAHRSDNCSSRLSETHALSRPWLSAFTKWPSSLLCPWRAMGWFASSRRHRSSIQPKLSGLSASNAWRHCGRPSTIMREPCLHGVRVFTPVP